MPGKPGGGPSPASARIAHSTGDVWRAQLSTDVPFSSSCQHRPKVPLADGFLVHSVCARARGGAEGLGNGAAVVCARGVPWGGVCVCVCARVCPPRVRARAVWRSRRPGSAAGASEYRSGRETKARCLSSGPQLSLGAQLGCGGCEAGARSWLAGARGQSGRWPAGRWRGEGALWAPGVPAGPRLPARRCAVAPRWVAWVSRASLRSALTGTTFAGWTPGPGPVKGGPWR